MKRVIALAVACCLLLIGCPAFAAATLPKVAKGDLILCYGDSITLVGRDKAYATILGRILSSARPDQETTVRRVFIDGAKTSRLAREFDERVLEKHAGLRWLVIQDAGAAEPLEDFKKGLMEILRKCRARKVKIVLVTTAELEPGFTTYQPGKRGNAHAKHNELRRQLANGKGVYLIDLEATWHTLLAKTDELGLKLTYDGCHPDEAGLAAIAVTLARDFGVDRSALSLKNLGDFKKLTPSQFGTIADSIYCEAE